MKPSPANVGPEPAGRGRLPETKRLMAKVVLVGDAATNKTALIRPHIDTTFDERYVLTLGAVANHKLLEVTSADGASIVQIDMVVWDVMGQKGFRELTREAYFCGTKGILAVCDVARKTTLDDLPGWIDAVYSTVGRVPVVLLANDNGGEGTPEIDEGEVQRVARRYDAPYFFTSSATGANIEAALQTLAERIMAGHPLRRDEPVPFEDLLEFIRNQETIAREGTDIRGRVRARERLEAMASGQGVIVPGTLPEAVRAAAVEALSRLPQTAGRHEPEALSEGAPAVPLEGGDQGFPGFKKPPWISVAESPPTTTNLKRVWMTKFENLGMHDSDPWMYPPDSPEGQRAMGRSFVWRKVKERAETADVHGTPRDFLVHLLEWAQQGWRESEAQLASVRMRMGHRSTDRLDLGCQGEAEAWRYAITALERTIQYVDERWDFREPPFRSASMPPPTPHELKLKLAWRIEVAMQYESDSLLTPQRTDLGGSRDDRVLTWSKIRDQILAEPEDGTPVEFIQNLMDFARLGHAGAEVALAGSRRQEGFFGKDYLQAQLGAWDYFIGLLQRNLDYFAAHYDSSSDANQGRVG